MAQWDAEYGELRLYIDNDYELHRQRQAIEENLKRKIKRGVYDPKKAPKLWGYMVDAGARKYCKEFGCSVRTTFPKQAVRQPLAEEYARDWETEYWEEQDNPRRSRKVNPMTKAEAWREFQAMILPAIKAKEAEGTGRVDKSLRRQEWNNYVDSLCRDGVISDKQCNTWSQPAGLMSNPKHTRPEKPRKKKRKSGRPKSPYARARRGGGSRKNPGKKISVRSLVAQALK